MGIEPFGISNLAWNAPARQSRLLRYDGGSSSGEIQLGRRGFAGVRPPSEFRGRLPLPGDSVDLKTAPSECGIP